MEGLLLLIILCIWITPGEQKNFWPSRKTSQLAKGNPCEIRNADGSIRKSKVLILVDSAYFNLFENWMVYYNEICRGKLRNLEVACVDQDVLAKIQRLNYSVQCSTSFRDVRLEAQPSLPFASTTTSRSLQQSGKGVAIIWIKRVQIIMQLIEQGYDVILSDTDALWRKNPLPVFSSYGSGSQIVSSRGWFPDFLSKRWGTTLCMGLIYFRSTSATLAFLRLVYRDMVYSEMLYRGTVFWKRMGVLGPKFPNHSNTSLLVHSHGSNISTATSPNASLPVIRTSLFCSEILSTSICRFQSPSKQTVSLRNVTELKYDIHPADDQLSINQVLNELAVQWPSAMPKTFGIASHNATVFIGNTALTVTLLPERQYMRNCRNENVRKVDRRSFPSERSFEGIALTVSNTTIVHCILTTGNSTTKEKYLILYGLWRLPSNGREQALAYIRNEWSLHAAERLARTRAKNTHTLSQISSMKRLPSRPVNVTAILQYQERLRKSRAANAAHRVSNATSDNNSTRIVW